MAILSESCVARLFLACSAMFWICCEREAPPSTGPSERCTTTLVQDVAAMYAAGKEQIDFQQHYPRPWDALYAEGFPVSLDSTAAIQNEAAYLPASGSTTWRFLLFVKDQLIVHCEQWDNAAEQRLYIEPREQTYFSPESAVFAIYRNAEPDICPSCVSYTLMNMNAFENEGPAAPY